MIYRVSYYIYTTNYIGMRKENDTISLEKHLEKVENATKNSEDYCLLIMVLLSDTLYCQNTIK